MFPCKVTSLSEREMAVVLHRSAAQIPATPSGKHIFKKGENV